MNELEQIKVNRILVSLLSSIVISGCASTKEELHKESFVKYEQLMHVNLDEKSAFDPSSEDVFEMTILPSSCEILKGSIESKESRMKISCSKNQVSIFTASDSYTIDYKHINSDGVYYSTLLNKPVVSWSDQSRLAEIMELMNEYIDINTNYVMSLYQTIKGSKSIDNYVNLFRYQTRFIPEMPFNESKARDIFEKTIFNEEWFNTNFAFVAFSGTNGYIPDQNEIEARLFALIKPELKYAFDGLSVEFCNPVGVTFEACAVTATPLSKNIVFRDSHVELSSYNQGSTEEPRFVIEVRNISDNPLSVKSANLLLNNLRFHAEENGSTIKPRDKMLFKIKHKKGWKPNVTVSDKLAATFYGLNLKYSINGMEMELKGNTYYNPLMMLNN